MGNRATGESSWEHPCDEIYRKIYRNEKLKKEMHVDEKSITADDKSAADLSSSVSCQVSASAQETSQLTASEASPPMVSQSSQGNQKVEEEMTDKFGHRRFTVNFPQRQIGGV